jgi:hypothetical protein
VFQARALCDSNSGPSILIGNTGASNKRSFPDWEIKFLDQAEINGLALQPILSH